MKDPLMHKAKESRDPFSVVRGVPAGAGWMLDESFVPSVDLKEEKDRLIVKADIPGVKKEEMAVTVHDDLLTLKVERKESQEKKEKDYYFSERFEGSFIRTIKMPSKVKADAVKASYKDGVLEIELPKDENARSREVKVRIQ